jgi:7,8-dihydropterin-6-yl-methyl-4-(beta-D-ribofuranosyl)aminobenzene 5'-phosphate synthase
MNVNSEKRPNTTINFREADSVELLSIMDNSADFLSTVNNNAVYSFRQWTKERYGKEWTRTNLQLPYAEHGFSALISVFGEGRKRSILFDSGVSSTGVVENAERMGLDLSEVECIVLSHGHYDHSGGLLSVVKAINNPKLSIIVHEDMFKKRGIADSDGTVRIFTEFPKKEQLSSVQLISTKEPALIADGLVLVTGEIPRVTSFEVGVPQHRVFEDGLWQPDPWVWDDRAVVINIKGKGLLVVSGCAHAGIVNTILYAQQITGIKDVFAVFGGFHLAGKEGERKIDQTVRELKRINPELVAPSHCTGWKALFAMAQAMPDAFVWNSVGNLYQLSNDKK